MTDFTTAAMAAREKTDAELAEAEFPGSDSGGGFNTNDGGSTEADSGTDGFCVCEFSDCTAASAAVNEAMDWDAAWLEATAADATAATAATEDWEAEAETAEAALSM